MVSRLPCSILAALLAAIPAALPAVDFIRGDLNSDGRVGMADGYWYVRWLYQGGPPPECMNAVDVSDRDFSHSSNIRGILSAVAVDYSIYAPFPTAGPDPTPNQNPLLVCDSYGHGSLLEDPLARITLLDATARGGDDDRVTITIAISSGAAVTGYFGSIRFQDSVVACISDHGSLGMDPGIGPMRDLSGTLNTDNRLPGYSGFCIGRTFNDRLQFGFLNTVTAKAMPAILPGELTGVAQFDLCLAPGTQAGRYAMILETGELVDAASARSIVPVLERGTLTVEADLAADKGCARPWVPFQCTPHASARGK